MSLALVIFLLIGAVIMHAVIVAGCCVWATHREIGNRQSEIKKFSRGLGLGKRMTSAHGAPRRLTVGRAPLLNAAPGGVKIRSGQVFPPRIYADAKNNLRFSVRCATARGGAR